MTHKKYKRIKKNEFLNTLQIFSLFSHSLLDWRIILKQYNKLTFEQKKSIVQEFQKREALLKEKISSTDDDMYFTCTMVNLNIVASEFDIDPNTVCLCINPLCNLNETIIVR